ncbi:MAG: lysophospholipase [Allobaculum sp.]|nr:lysophospholipase [Allobaculum sp.]
MNIKTKWIATLFEGLFFLIPLVLLFINWKWGLIAIAIALLLFSGYCLLILYAGLNTKIKFGVASMINMADTLRLSDQDKQTIAWIEEKGEKKVLYTPDGQTLEGRFLNHPSSKGIVYVCHGYGDYKYISVQVPIKHFYDMGYSVFVHHSRGFGNQNGQWTGMGVVERQDHLRWLNRLIHEHPNQNIFLYGVSMGGASVMNLCDADLPQIKGIIEDCGYVSLYDQMEHALKSVLQVPEWPVLPIASWLCEVFCKYSLKDLNVQEKLASSNYPLLAFHGREDTFVPYTNLDRVIQSAGDHLIEAHMIEGAKHCQSFLKAAPFYWQTIDHFFKTYNPQEVIDVEAIEIPTLQEEKETSPFTTSLEDQSKKMASNSDSISSTSSIPSLAHSNSKWRKALSHLISWDILNQMLNAGLPKIKDDSSKDSLNSK